VFEAERELGGLLRHGIPAYRLPRAVLEREIELTLALGVAVETGCRLNGAAASTLAGWDAVFLAAGAGVPITLDAPRARATNVLDGLAMLRAVNGGARPQLGARAVVVGGGSSAMDVARTARRLGVASVTVVALEARDAMPAIADEVTQALAEGVEIRNRAAVQAFTTRADVATAALVAPARLGRAPDGSIVPVFEGEAAPLAADTFIFAIGQRADLGALPWALDADGGVVAVGPSGETSQPRIFAGGDLAARERTVAHAIGSGTRAARAITAMLSGAARPSVTAPWVTTRPDVVVGPDAVGLHSFATARRATRWERLPGSRVASFIEVVDGLDGPAARAEAERCFSCGRCTACDTCRLVCPDVAITRAAGGYHVSSAHCKGCGLCARECPRGALEMVAEA
jgi:NADPH-dependent glutamate synthase beta subunit-like oxidoreductase